MTWIDDLAERLTPAFRRPRLSDPGPTELLNLIRQAQGLPAQTHEEYIAEQQARYDRMTDAERAEEAAWFAARIEEERARVAREEAIFCGETDETG
ncbi:hypothetical protein CFP71_01380 [Amycolatopsis thailandensis]|uniref:Uncharacterized protein n=1 Tax=Amycolatopsis thailandensis TaxID=589330 RepID=A0A229SIT4_9PSEU|nr:hypothetical protein [Amycolatopsis thailandensis]OXM58694.1 hypothetical protein CFP71_01380 [Amycolatopsis thailandensis]